MSHGAAGRVRLPARCMSDGPDVAAQAVVLLAKLAVPASCARGGQEVAARAAGLVGDRAAPACGVSDGPEVAARAVELPAKLAEVLDEYVRSAAFQTLPGERVGPEVAAHARELLDEFTEDSQRSLRTRMRTSTRQRSEPSRPAA